MVKKTLSVPRTIAEHYCADSRDFIERFDILLEHPLTKTGRVKRFIDLLMGCECILKAHIFLCHLERNPCETYSKIRGAGHKIDKLADLACFNQDRENYDFLKSTLQPFSVFLRYSLDASDTFFPMRSDWDNADINYSETIANRDWLISIRQHVILLTEELSAPLGGWVEDDLLALNNHAEKMEEFMRYVYK